MTKVYLQTYGCQMNEYDTEVVRAILEDNQYELVNDEHAADIVMLNTCSVRENANNKVYTRVDAIRSKRNGRPVHIGILGCMATNFRKALLDDPGLGIDFTVGPDSYKRLPEVLAQVQATGEKGFDVTLSEFETYEDVYPSRKEGVNAWIAVMRGCDNFCTFCVVPYTRGRERSRSPSGVVDEARRLAGEGFRQVTLLGQNVNSYRHEEGDFADLLERVSEVKGIERIRFTSPHPKDFPDCLLRVVAENPKVCKHIHLPLQAGADRVLAKMNRTYTQVEYLELVDRIRDRCPGIGLSTDIIVGFPTETAAEFDETARVMAQVRYDSAYIFKYSERPKTIAGRTLPDDVTAEEKTRRIVHLNELQKAISLEQNQARIGQVQEILIEQETTRKSDEDFQGRTDANQLVIVPGGPYGTGTFCNAEITDATANVLKGRVVSGPTR